MVRLRSHLLDTIARPGRHARRFLGTESERRHTMAEVTVVIPKTGDPIALNDYVPALWEDFIRWDIHCDNKAVKYVWVGFKNEGATYFPNGSTKQTWCLKELKNRNTGPEKRTARTKTIMWGQCPDYSDNKPNPPRHEQYCIYGLEDKWEKKDPPTNYVCKLDPEIDPIDPRNP